MNRLDGSFVLMDWVQSLWHHIKKRKHWGNTMKKMSCFSSVHFLGLKFGFVGSTLLKLVCSVLFEPIPIRLFPLHFLKNAESTYNSFQIQMSSLYCRSFEKDPRGGAVKKLNCCFWGKQFYNSLQLYTLQHFLGDII
jgi:hypothetical protein